MPQAAAAAVVKYFALTGVAKAIVGAVVYAVVTAAINYGLSRVSQALAGKPKKDSTGPVRDVTVRGTVEPMQIIYGEVRSGGFIAFYGTSGTNNRYLHFVIVYAAHQCEDILDVWLDSRRVLDGDIDADGDVTSSPFQDAGVSRLRVRRFLGTSAQAADGELVSAFTINWSTAHRGAGVAYVHYRLDKSEAVWPAGAPSSFFALVRGRRLYDPRLDSTNGGSGSHRYNDATTWAWSQNAALALRDYISGGSRWYDVATPEKRLAFGDDDARINDDFTIAAANICDEDVAIPSTPSTQDRYTCDAQLSCGDTHRENLDVLKSALAGNVTYVNGQYRIYAGAYLTPDVALTEDEILGPMTVSTHPNGEALYNFVTGTFFDEWRDWSHSPFPNITNSSYEADDGGQYPRKIELHATRTSYRAQRIAILHLAQSRNKITVRFDRLSPKAMAISQYETFTVTISEYGWSAKVFRCLDWEWMPDGFIAITAREESSAAYADPSTGTYAEADEFTVSTPEYDEPDTPINFEAVSVRGGVVLRWEMPTPENSTTTFRIYEHTASTPFASATLIEAPGNSKTIFLERSAATRYYWISGVLNGIESPTTPAGAGLAGAALAPAEDGEDGAPGAAGPTGPAGANGSNGANALTVSLTPTAKTVACNAAGVPASGELPIAVTTTVYSGSTNVTSSVSYGHAASGCSVTNSGGGVYSITAIAAESGYLQVTASYGGAVAIARMSWSKARAGAASSSARDNSLTINSSSSYSGTQGGPLTIPVGPGGTITLSVAHNYTAISSDGRIAGSFQYRTTPGSGGWTTVGTEQDGTQAVVGVEDGALSFDRTLSGPGTPTVWEFQYINRRSSGAAPTHMNGEFYVSYAP